MRSSTTKGQRMKNVRPLLLIALSLAVGAGAVGIALHWVLERTDVASTKVVVAARDLPFGTPLREGMLEVIDWPAANALKEPVTDPKLIYQRVTNAQILRGEPVLPSKLAPQGEKGGLSALLHDGTRAVTVKINEIVGVAGFALPGNYVDVMVNATEKSGRVVSKIVLERILVLALAQDASTSETKPRLGNAVTLEVTPQQAEQIDLARSVGALSLVLRSQVDTGRVNTQGASMEDLFKSAEKALDRPTEVAMAAQTTPAKPPRAPEAKTIKRLPDKLEKPEIIRGSVKTLE
jgi:pilus assembly protein CpaB